MLYAPSNRKKFRNDNSEKLYPMLLTPLDDDYKGEDAEQSLSESPRICLLDDDPTYGRVMAKIAQRMELDLIVCESVDDLPALSDNSFDVAIVDYDLGSVTGVEVTEYLEHFLNGIPILMISGTIRNLGNESYWPKSVRKFLSKELGPDKIISEALKSL
jgi:CheY-like chemotaxis protein